MIIDLDKKGLISLVSGEQPNYAVFGNPMLKSCGRYSDVMGWCWDKDALEKCTEQELYDLYFVCRNSWE